MVVAPGVLQKFTFSTPRHTCINHQVCHIVVLNKKPYILKADFAEKDNGSINDHISKPSSALGFKLGHTLWQDEYFTYFKKL